MHGHKSLFNTILLNKQQYILKENNWTNINITKGLELMQDVLDCRLTSEISKDYLKYISTFTHVDSYVTRNKYIWKNCSLPFRRECNIDE